MVRKFQKLKVLAAFTIFTLIYLLFVYFPIFNPNLQSSSTILKSSNLQVWPRIVVSLSSFPGRLERVEATLKSLLSQSLQPTMLYLAIPETVERLHDVQLKEYPQFLKDIEVNNPNFKILSTIDYGPSTKLLPALLEESDPTTIIITVDDDVVYHHDTIRTISATLMESKRLGLRIAPTWDCEEWSSWLQAPYRPFTEGICKGWVGAYSGYLY